MTTTCSASTTRKSSSRGTWEARKYRRTRADSSSLLSRMTRDALRDRRALMPPGYLKQWHIGITWKGKLMAFISAIPAVLHVYNAYVL